MKDKLRSGPTGRPVPDDRGNTTWEWSLDGELNTARLRAITEGIAIAPPGTAQTSTTAAGLDPYNRTQFGGERPAPRRTLDDMRRLSEEIKRKKQALATEGPPATENEGSDVDIDHLEDLAADADEILAG